MLSFFLFHATILIAQVDYTTQVQPIFFNHCLDCHISVNGSGALELDSYEYLMEGDSNNGPVVMPFNADSSLLYRVLLRDSVIVPNEPICCRMPKNADPLTNDQQIIIYNWINEGAIGSTVSIEDESLDQSSSLQAYPNPFNNKVKLSYSVNGPGLTYVLIFDILGKKIKTMSKKDHNNTLQSLFWDGTDDLDRPVSGGLYLIGIKDKNRIEILQKVLYIK